ncbi:MAG: hypothetical protein KDA41_16865 [Planctomycetales bacterium]|nr:hypothetical protein [Planctomycetales bacterium]
MTTTGNLIPNDAPRRRPRLWSCFFALLSCTGATIIVGLLFLCTFSEAILDWIAYDLLLKTGKTRVAVYDNAQFRCYDAKSPEFYSALFKCGGVATRNVQLRLPGGQVLALETLDEATYTTSFEQELRSDECHYQVFTAHDGRTLVYVNGSIAAFRGGTLEQISIPAGSAFSFSLTSDGPFYELPVKKDVVLDALGEPLRWETHRNRGVY